MKVLEKLGLHENRVNLARRWSVQNEPDLLAENFYEDDEERNYSRKECASIASHLEHLKHLPAQCTKFQDIASDLKRRDSDTTHGSQVLS